jgi:hypothetical protein
MGLFPTSPVHRLQGRFAWSGGHPGSPRVFLAGVLAVSPIDQADSKKFVCSHYGHKDHRDANAAFTLSSRVEPIGGLARDSAGSRSALLVEPFLGSMGASLGPVRLTTCQ